MSKVTFATRRSPGTVLELAANADVGQRTRLALQQLHHAQNQASAKHLLRARALRTRLPRISADVLSHFY
jgi:hypothetical protein